MYFEASGLCNLHPSDLTDCAGLTVVKVEILGLSVLLSRIKRNKWPEFYLDLRQDFNF